MVISARILDAFRRSSGIESGGNLFLFPPPPLSSSAFFPPFAWNERRTCEHHLDQEARKPRIEGQESERRSRLDAAGSFRSEMERSRVYSLGGTCFGSLDKNRVTRFRFGNFSRFINELRPFLSLSLSLVCNMLWRNIRIILTTCN